MNALKNFLRKNNHAFGILLALVLSASVYFALTLMSGWFAETFAHRYLRREVVFLLSIFINLLPFRTYMVSLKLEKTGRGILIAMFVLSVLYFIFVHQTNNA